MKGGAHGAVVLLACIAGFRPLAAQNYSNLSGSVVDPSGAGVPGAQISVINEETGFRRTAHSQPDGAYRIASLQPGVYKITLRKPGFRTLIRFGVRLDALQPARVDFALAVGSMQETITVEGAAPLLRSDDASVGTLIERTELERLPLNGRGVMTLLELAPGTVSTPATRGEAGQFTVNGQRPNTHYFTVDGVSANTGISGGGAPAQSTGGSMPGLSAFGSLHSLISLESLEEFRVQTSTTAPESGRMPGANVSLSSRSGTNELHGSVFYQFRHELLAANDWFANADAEGRAPLRLSDFGQSLGGPLRRDRTFFFLSYEGMRLRQPSAWRAAVPSVGARETAPDWARFTLNLFPPPNGPPLSRDLAQWTGRNNRPARLDVGSLRIDHAVNSRLSVFGRYNDSPSYNEFGVTQVNRLDLRARSLTLGANLRATTRLVADLRANASYANGHSLWTQQGALAPCYMEPLLFNFFRTPGHCDELVRFSIAGVGQVVSGSEGDRGQSQYQVLPTANWNPGLHSIRLGMDHRRLAPTRRDAAGSLGVIAGSVADLADIRNMWIATADPQTGSSVLKEVSLFWQDTWQISQRLTLNYGLRWEFSSVYSPNYKGVYLTSPTNAKADERPIWRPSYTNFAPRLGVAFRPSSGSGTVFRAGAGIYYESSLSVATDLVNGGPLSIGLYTSGRYAPFGSALTFGFLPDLKLPVIQEWNMAVEHSFSAHDVGSLAYVGSHGRRLLRREIGGPASSQTDWLELATNHGSSGYHALQLQYRRRFARRLQALASYTWSHSIDNSSSDALLHWAAPGFSPDADRGSSDFDVRHMLHAALTYELRGWALDGIFRARTGFPLNILSNEQYLGISLANGFRPDLLAGQPVWLADGSVPGGRRLNPAAFRPAPGGTQGNLGRNAITGFGMSEVDLAVRREFSLGDRWALELRVEAFNALNQANFADPTRFLVSPLFGQSTSMLNLMLGTGSPGSGLAPMLQIGGARSVQLSLRLRF